MLGAACDHVGRWRRWSHQGGYNKPSHLVGPEQAGAALVATRGRGCCSFCLWMGATLGRKNEEGEKEWHAVLTRWVSNRSKIASHLLHPYPSYQKHSIILSPQPNKVIGSSGLECHCLVPSCDQTKHNLHRACLKKIDTNVLDRPRYSIWHR